MVQEYGNTLLLKVVTPQRLVYSDVAEMVVVPGSEGVFGVLPGHVPFISSLQDGRVETFVNHKRDRHIFVTKGFVQVSDDSIYVLSEFAHCLEETNIAEVKNMIAKLEKQRDNASDDGKKKILERDIKRHELLIIELEKFGKK